MAAQEAAAEAAAAEEAALRGSVVKSPSDYSQQSYELFIGQEKGNPDDNNREKMSIRSDSLSHCRRPRRVSNVSRHSTLLSLLFALEIKLL